jgi:putative inorganic carbon (HCO3(-)) transporter
MTPAVPLPGRGRPDMRGDMAMLVLAVLAAGLAAGSVAASRGNVVVPVVLVGAIPAVAVAIWRPFAVMTLGVLVIPLEGFFPGLVGPSQALLGLGAVGWIARWAASPPLTLPRQGAITAFAALMAVEAAGLLFADEPAIVARQVATWGALLVVAAAIAHSATPRQVRQLLFALAVTGGLAGAVAIVDPQPLTGAVFLGTSVSRATGGLGSPNALGMLLALCLPLQAVFALRADTMAKRWIGGACVALALVGMGLAVSRGAFAGLGAAIVVLALWAPFRRAALILLPLLIVLSLVGSNPVSPFSAKITERLTDRSTAGTSNPRVELWKKTPAMIKDHPVFGIGGLEFLHEAPAYGMATQEGIPNHAHSLLLTMTAESGFAGLAAFLALLGSVALALRRTLRSVAGLERGLAFAMVAGFGGFFVNGILDYALGAAPIAAAFFVLVGCAVGLRVPASERTSRVGVGVGV